MDLDEELCLCFHVSRRKVVNFLRVERPRRAGQLADCFGAGTGCGWCRPFLRKLFEEAQAGDAGATALPSAEEYEALRRDFIRQGHGTPPGASPEPEPPQAG